MASTPSSHSADRDRAASVTRRQLLTTRGSQDAPPRVVLHLPDLDALSAVALGPARPAERRRIDPAHAVVADRYEEPTASKAETKSKPLSAAVKKQLFELAKAPVGELYEQVAPNGKLSIPRLVLLLQSPKLLLAGVMAIGLQFAAILAMFTGGTAPDVNEPAATNGTMPSVAGAPGVTLPQVSLPPTSPFAGSPGPIQTPLSPPNSFAPSLPGFGTPTVVAQPSLPPPQSLPGMQPGELPAWGEEKLAQPATGPSANSVEKNAANAPASIVAPSLTSPAVSSSGLPSPTLANPSLPSNGPTSRTTPAVQTTDAGAKKKVRLQGTIKPASVTETSP
jgi:hypothetical protein